MHQVRYQNPRHYFDDSNFWSNVASHILRLMGCERSVGLQIRRFRTLHVDTLSVPMIYLIQEDWEFHVRILMITGA